ncbi:MAG: DUF1573 domain-containing protein [Bacteroidetes bacterium]|nr:DUF1573 domain-containing protein [Bacteroidota bacterium]
MKHKLLYLFLVLLVSFISISFTSDNDVSISAKDPKIVFTETVHNFGKVEQGIELNHSFEFKNKGKGVLEITGVSTSCGCTGAVLDGKKEYKRNETGEIKVKFNTQGRTGINRKTITVSSNDPANPTVTLAITCDIQNVN